jgi:hypothetical protein
MMQTADFEGAFRRNSRRQEITRISEQLKSLFLFDIIFSSLIRLIESKGKDWVDPNSVFVAAFGRVERGSCLLICPFYHISHILPSLRKRKTPPNLNDMCLPFVAYAIA